MEEVVSSNLTRSTKTSQRLTVPPPAKHVITGVQLESKPNLMHGQREASSRRINSGSGAVTF